MSKKYKGLIFDLDGTLVDTIEDIADSMNEVLRINKEDLYSYDEYKQLVGRGFNNLIIDSFKKEIGDDLLKELRRELDLVYSNRYLNKSRPYKGIESVLDTLVDKKVLIGINTNKKDEYAKEILEKLFPNIEFIEIIGQRNNIKVKPDPEGALSIINTMGLNKEDVLYIGDSNVDIFTGQNAGLDTLGVAWGFRGREELEKSGAVYVIDNAHEILNFVI